jgi:hypothetical protein
VIRDVHADDGPDKIAVHNNVNLSGNLGFQRFDVPTHPPVKWGIGISVGVHFGGGSVPGYALQIRLVPILFCKLLARPSLHGDHFLIAKY